MTTRLGCLLLFAATLWRVGPLPEVLHAEELDLSRIDERDQVTTPEELFSSSIDYFPETDANEWRRGLPHDH